MWGADEDGEEDKFYIFSTTNSILGMIKKPIDGNPHKNIGIVAHPTQLRNFCVKSSEGLIFTSGGEDYSIKVWSINKDAIERQLKMAEGLLELSEEEKLIQMVGNVEL
jgi:WD40 repeat protein